MRDRHRDLGIVRRFADQDLELFARLGVAPRGDQQAGVVQARIARAGISLDESFQKNDRLVRRSHAAAPRLEQRGQFPAGPQFQRLARGSQRRRLIVGVPRRLRHCEAGLRYLRIVRRQRAQHAQDRGLVLMAGDQRRQLQEVLADVIRFAAQPLLQDAAARRPAATG